MTMPKFEPVGLPDLPAAVSKGNLGAYLFDTMQMHQYAMRYLDLHADQLTKAYEAGKRDAIPEGWVLVPKEPPEIMLVLGQEECALGPKGAIEDCIEAQSHL